MSVTSRKLSYHHGTGDIPLIPYTIGQILNKNAQEYPDNEMYVFYADKERYTFSQFRDQTHQFASGLLNLGLEKRDRIGVWGLAHKEYLLTYHACAQIGLILIRLVSPPVTDLNGKLLRKLGYKALVICRTPVNGYEEVCKLVPELPTSEPGQLNSSSLPDLKIIIGADETFSNCKGIFTVGDVIKSGGPCSEAVKRITSLALDIDNEEDFTIMFTSGSTGLPKATTHSQSNLLNANRAAGVYRKGTGFQRDWKPKVAGVAPPYAMGPKYSVLNPIVNGGTTVFTCPIFDADLVLRAVHEEKCTESIMLIHHLYDLVNHPDLDKYEWSSMKCILVGGSIIPDSVILPAKEKLSRNIMLGYGSTEVCISFIQCPTDSKEKLSTGGLYATPHTEVKIVNDKGLIVSTNTIGEIYVRCPYTFNHYWSDEEATRQSRDANGFFKTGDLGVMDDDGYFRCLGRKKEMISKGGLNFFPKELENILEQHTNVSKAVVFGVPDKRTLNEVCACVKLVSSKIDTKSPDLIDFCKGKVHDLLIPRHVFIISELPTTPTGKFHRKQLRDWAIEQLNLHE